MAHQIVSRALVLLCIMLQGADRAQGAGSRQRHTKTAFALRTSLPSAPGAPRRARREGVRAAAGTGCTRLVRRAGLPATRSAAQRRHVLAYGRGRARLAGWALRSHCSASTLRQSTVSAFGAAIALALHLATPDLRLCIGVKLREKAGPSISCLISRATLLLVVRTNKSI